MHTHTSPPSEINPTPSDTEDAPRLWKTRLREEVSENLPSDADRSLVAGAVLTQLYYDRPWIRLEDVLELNQLITSDETDGDTSSPLDEQVQHVLDLAQSHLDEWDVPAASDATAERRT